MKKIAFTLMEILIAMSIIGVMATATLSQLKRISADKTKMAFKNCYNHMLKLTDKIISDETLYPNIPWAGQGNDSTGHPNRVPLKRINIEYKNDIKDNRVEILDNSLYFPLLFQSLSQTPDNNLSSSETYFTLKDGSYWTITMDYNTPIDLNENITDIAKADYRITFDVNGLNEGTNCPYNGSYLSNHTSGTCEHPDTFKFGLTWNNKIITDSNSYYNGKNLATFLSENKYIE